MNCESKCAKWFRSGDAACKGCGSCERCEESCIGGIPIDEIGPSDCENCDEPNCDDRVADYIDDDNVDNDGVGDHDIPAHEDEFGNRGDKLYEVEVKMTVTRMATVKVTVAADDEEAARSIGQIVVENMNEEENEMEFYDECESSVVSCEEKDDYQF